MIEALIFIVVVLILAIVLFFFRKIAFFILNSAIGLLALFGFNSLFNADVVINLWSILISGIGGAFGLVIVLILHFLGLAF